MNQHRRDLIALHIVVWAAVLLVIVLLLAGCTSGGPNPIEESPAGPLSTVSTGISTPSGVSSTSGAPAPTATVPSAAASSRSPVRTAPRPPSPTLTVLPRMPTVIGYSRSQFGPAWTDNNTATPDGHNGCDTRNDVLREQLTSTTKGRACSTRSQFRIVLAGTLHDPYTGRVIPFSTAKPLAVQIDHIVPLHYAWNVGAWRWTMTERVRFANDTVTELLAVDGRQNEIKGDDGPSEWLPPNTAYRCTYLQRFTDVLRTYHLPIVQADLTAAGSCVK